MKGKVLVFLSILTLFILPHIVMAENPTSETFTVYKTELLMDQNATPVVILDDQNGIQSDIIANPESIFGTGSAPSGTYKRIHFVVKNSFSYSGPDPCGSGNPVSGTGLINPQQGPDVQVDLYFATSDDGGGSGWYNNGTAQYPFLMQSPIVIASGKETIVKLIFNTANTLQCNANNSPVLFPPSMNVTSVIKDIAGACGITDAPYWFVHYNMSVWPRVCDNPDCSSYHLPATPQEIFQNTTIVAGWGTVQFNADDTWQVDLSQNYINNGMSEHRHNLLELRPDDGYKDTLGGGIITGTYTRSGNRITMYFPEGGYIEGAVSSDCKTFTGVNITGDQENDLVFALKKGTGLSTIAHGKYLMSQPGFNLCYDVSGSNCYSSGDNKIKYLSYRNEIGFIDTQLGPDGTSGHWENSFEYAPQYDGSGNLTAVKIRAPREELGINPFPISSLDIRDDGLITTPVDDPMFFAFGENRNGLFAAVATNENEGNDRINVGFMVKIADNPALSDLNGRWYISIIEAQVRPGSDGSWETLDDESRYGLTTGEIVINNGTVVSRSFMHKNIFDGSIEYESGSGETIQLKTECYKPSEDVLTACSDPNAPRIPVFYIYGTGSEAGRILAKMTIDSAKKALTFWAPVDLDNRPPTGACEPPREGYYCDQTGGSQKAIFGVGVKIE